jgi:hypothetical protein
MPGPAVDLDRELGIGEGDVDDPALERSAELPAGQPGITEKCDQEAFGGGVGAIGRPDQECGNTSSAAGAYVAAVRLVEVLDADVLLEGAVEERRAVGQRDRGLQRREWGGGAPDTAGEHRVGGRQVAAADPDAGVAAQSEPARHGHLDPGGERRQHPVPPGRGRSRDHSAVAGPQAGGTDPAAVGEPLPRREEHARCHPPPPLVLGTPLQGSLRKTALGCLDRGDQSVLAGEQREEGPVRDHGRQDRAKG